MKKIIITGSHGLAEFIGWHHDTWHLSATELIEKFEEENAYYVPHEFDIFINCEHNKFKQVYLLDKFFKMWKDNHKKHIINISSRAAQPNISPGFLYASQKAALNHYTNNIIYNSDAVCRVTTMNLGLMAKEELPSLVYEDIMETIEWIIDAPDHGGFAVSDITMQDPANYKMVQEKKRHLKLKKKWWLEGVL